LALSKKRIRFWKDEMAMLDRLYNVRMKEWQKNIDLYDLKFTERIRDLDPKELVRISRFYPIVRQIIASTSFNYPKLFFAIEEDEGTELATVLERASTNLLELMETKPHVHQAIFDALTCAVGWLRIDFNHRGTDLIPPYTVNDINAEDLTSVSRVPPWNVHLDPQCSPHRLGDARYIREKMWIPLKSLKDDDNIRNKNQLKATTVGRDEDMAFGSTQGSGEGDEEEMRALRTSVENDDMVLVDRIHDRVNRRLIMFADGVEEPIQDVEHPFSKMSFPQSTDVFGQPILDENDEPLLDLGNGVSVPGWLVVDGFPFVPVKFDVSSKSYYPEPHLKYLQDIQNTVVESVSRRANLLKRTSRQLLANQEELKNNLNIQDDIRKGVDGQIHSVLDINSFRELQYGEIPADQLRIEQDVLNYEEKISRVSDLEKGGNTPRSATEAAMVGAQISVNRESMQAVISEVYTKIVRDCFQIFGDNRYTPDNFRVNMMPNGEKAVTQVLTNANFLFAYRITVQAGSMQPMFEQIQGQKFLDFFDRAINRPNFDQVELDRMLANSVDMIDVEKVMSKDLNPEATQAATLENQLLLQGEDPGVITGQDHKAHIETHGMINEDPQVLQLMEQAQEVGFDGQPTNPQASEQLQQISALMQQHILAHEEAQEAESASVGSTPGPGASSGGAGGIESVVRGNAQRVSNTMRGEAQEVSDGA
jgi:hypothetical protein